MQTNELIKVVDESGLETQTSSYLKEKFLPFFEQAEKWKSQAEKLVVTDVSQKKEMMLAREARLALRDIRIQADKTRKALKEDSLRYGKAVQGVYNVIEYLVVPIEKYLEEQERFEEIQEQNRKAALKAVRDEEIQIYSEFIPFGLDLGEMSDENYQKLLNGAKMQYNAQIEAQKKAEEERLAKERAEAEERERIRIENEKLRKEAELREKQLAEERAKAEAIEEQARKEREKLEAEKRVLEEQARKEREIIEAEKREQELKLAEQRRFEEQARLAPDRDKLIALSNKISSLELPELSSDKANKVLDDVKILINKLSTFIVEKSASI